ncbi:hypothetical protein AZI86_02810 [Bdellovibrio bacteriovorus]|uniref:Uncharacterized protein n=1 Tax=Bdellovibrio bacteriovorus TaxID=959 RepID=A0A150WNS7_BDEBC|nr:hypothetical protein [Bdellovibrio bacteriovorus]KYG66016.1 hypothetical protein AZI86_02810 [Bdellovibrio bacteriovorus]
MNVIKNLIIFGMIFSMCQIASAKPWDIWELREELNQRASVGQSLFCNSEVGKFSITVDNAKNIIMNGLVYNGGILGGDSWVENQLCETTLDEVLCYYGTGKWVGINLTKMYVAKADGDHVGAQGRRIVIPGTVKTSFLSGDLERISCTLPL